ncbi:carbohydrate ABC transporter ATP-binding protein (CUT1 family) [Rhizobium sp. ERR 922]|uniref:ABC transporter ATP-binding protein n=1 Tax=Rhizobium dioscoreae TaxID=2653122 RepID=A0ABQ0Z9T9_9HYPH|nr:MULTISPECIES: sn-glycerol-3-phosphate ABC transporter ATP-binding protein UgpC [Rhizobium]MCZ3376080.1 sn-glycerol-3-phosphate ABC transporter ATP-binding protein UgpC [Rhizobium sp. AG207R]TWB11812.1 carbohydrate ABC transporter ATP-binding protein (CUT1 family) [Rhizobium sp. ERR1071]TWB51830.1 carbohydrate ABC transporter ATP-binding protein (CUT1 family) [Rhizobium sp. ERR 922]TWB94252.1 carbohydrate ABC transporter ATP-binding protein (CUT1 family) [Rhizobium sp. ERR 942]GES52274.1 ABC
MASVELHNIHKAYGALTVIHDISLSIEDGEFIALVGPSGCGKSTLLRMIAGLEEITDGDVSIGGQVVNSMTPRERNIAMVFQSYALYPHMTVAENMGFNLKLSGETKQVIEQRVNEAARMLDLTKLLDRKPAQLSGGQRQRVAMGRAIVRNPAVFLFDEPLSNLDAKLRVQMRSEIKALHQKVQTTSIYVTHDQIEAMTLADRIVVLNQGRIEQQGTPIELYRKPANLFVAGFIGSPAMNFLDGVVEGVEGVPAVRLKDSTPIRIAGERKVKAGQSVKVGLRPEHLSLASAGSPLTGQTLLVEPTGAQTHVLFDLAGEQVTAVVDGEAPVRYGQPLNVSVSPEQVYVFDAASGLAL